MTYRPDIDGLRAIAVALVICFHAQVAFSGGFVGVDVFFVISGFLITGIIRKQSADGRFLLREFWIRRVRRIIPAAAFMTFSTLVCGYFFLFPNDYESLAQSALFQQAMAANVYFWRNTGYFSGRADMMPLLHTWSLAVEEQFYLFYPVVLTVLAGRGQRTLFWILAVAAAASFCASEVAVHRYPNAAFFLLPTRAWELLLGGLISFVPRRGLFASRFTANVASTLGIAMVFLAAGWYTPSLTFPGVAAALPCCGTALVILGGTFGSPFINRTLSTWPFVITGLASYSLYLWHWPFLVFLRHLAGPRPGAFLTAVAVGGAVVVSFLSWRWIERPFRTTHDKNNGNNRLLFTLGSIPAICLMCLLILTNRGFPSRASEKALRYHAASGDATHNAITVTTTQVQTDECPVLGDRRAKPLCLLWGDSHAASIAGGVDAAAQLCGVQVRQVTYFGTAPILDFYVPHGLGLKELAVPHSAAVLEYAKRNRIDVVVLAAFWTRYQSNALLEQRLRQTIDAFVDAGIKVAVVLDYAMQNEDVPLMLAREAFRGNSTSTCGVSMASYLQENGDMNLLLRRVVGDRAIILDPAPYLTDEKQIWRAEIGGEALYTDDDHLTRAGSLRLMPMFSAMFEAKLSCICEGGE